VTLQTTRIKPLTHPIPPATKGRIYYREGGEAREGKRFLFRLRDLLVFVVNFDFLRFPAVFDGIEWVKRMPAKEIACS
jgi:hypothetical protein